MASNHQLLLRQWTMLRMIPRYPRKITAREMMEKLSSEGFTMTKRSVERDLQSISATFPLVSDEREKPYGWSWAQHAPSFDLPGLSPSEALTFKLAQDYLTKLMPHNMVLQLAPYFESADKTLNATDHTSRLSNWHHKIAVALPGQPLLAPEIDPIILHCIETALIEERQLTVEYVSRQETSIRQYTVHPLGLILRGQISYLACTLFGYQDIRLLAMHRIKSVVKLTEQSIRPGDFSVKDYAHSSALGFNDLGLINLCIKFKTEAALHLYETPLSVMQTIEEVADGYVIVKAEISDNAQLSWWILGFGDQVEVLAPMRLRQDIANISKSLARTYTAS